MDLIFSYEDGSQYLCHYGRKGQKWGQHIFTRDNPDKYYKKMTNDIKAGHKETSKWYNRYEAQRDKAQKYEHIAERSFERATNRGLMANKYAARASRLEARNLGNEKTQERRMNRAKRISAKGSRANALKYWYLYKNGRFEKRRGRALRKAEKYAERSRFYGQKTREVGQQLAKTLSINNAVVKKPDQKTVDLVNSYLNGYSYSIRYKTKSNA